MTKRKPITDITPTLIRAVIESQIEDTSLPEAVEKTLANFDGKPATRRIKTAMEAAWPKHTFHMEIPGRGAFGRTYLYVWGDGIPYDNRKSFSLPVTDGKYVAAEFREKNPAYFAYERNAKRRELLADKAWIKRTADAMNALNKARVALTELLGDSSYDMPDYYDLHKLVDKCRQVRIAG